MKSRLQGVKKLNFFFGKERNVEHQQQQARQPRNQQECRTIQQERVTGWE
jgi:hypothetical protein